MRKIEKIYIYVISSNKNIIKLMRKIEKKKHVNFSNRIPYNATEKKINIYILQNKIPCKKP